MSWWILAAIPASFLFHNVLHELAHGLVAKWTNGVKFKIYPFPSMKLGRWTWAHVTYDRLITTRETMVYSAPVLFELLWFIIIVLSASFLPAWLVLLEMIACTVDIGNWFSGYWNPKASPNCDAEKFRAAWWPRPFSRREGRVASLVYMFTLIWSMTVMSIAIF